MDKDNIMHQDTVALDPQTEELVILDQTRLPGQTVFLRCLRRKPSIRQSILCRCAGAPAIGRGGGHRHLCRVPADAGDGLRDLCRGI